MFATGSDWTALGFIYVTDTDADDRTLFGKWVSASDRFSIRVDVGAAPRTLHIRVNGSRIAYTAANISENTWYLVGCRHTGASNLLEAFVLTPSLSVVDIGANTGTNTFTGNTADLAIGNERSTATASDEMAGNIAFASYFTSKLTDNELRTYAVDPLRALAQKRDTCLFYLPMLGVSQEPDWSGNGRSGTLGDSPGVGANPPVKFSFFTGAAAPISAGSVPQAVIPDVAAATPAANDPAAFGSAQAVTPTAVAATGVAETPTTQNPVSVVPAAAAITPTASDPTLLANVNLTPLEKAQGSTAEAPTIVATVSVVPGAVDATGQPQTPSASVSATTVEPPSVAGSPTPGTPTLALGGVSVTPGGIPPKTTALTPALAVGGVILAPDTAVVVAVPGEPSGPVGGVSVAPRAGAASVSEMTRGAGAGAAQVAAQQPSGPGAAVVPPAVAAVAAGAGLVAVTNQISSPSGAAVLPGIQVRVGGGAAVVPAGQPASQGGAAIVE